MRGQMIRLTSVTYAIRAQKLLEQQGIRSSVRKLTRSLNVNGCGYALEVMGDLSMAMQILSAAGIRVVEVLKEENP